MTKQVILSQNEYDELVRLIADATAILKTTRYTKVRDTIEHKLNNALKILEGEDMDIAKLKRQVHSLEMRPTYPY